MGHNNNNIRSTADLTESQPQVDGGDGGVRSGVTLRAEGCRAHRSKHGFAHRTQRVLRKQWLWLDY